MRILDRSVYVGPSLYAHFPVINWNSTWANWKPGPPASWARPIVDALVAALPGCSTAAAIASRAASSAACARTRAPGSATCWSMSRSSCRTSPARTSPSARPAASTAGRVHGGLRVRAADEGIEAGELALRCCVAVAGRTATRGRGRARRLAVGERARRVHPLRAAPRAGAVDGIAGEGGRGARHPLAAPERAVAGAARPRQVPAAHPGHGDRPHPAHRGGAGAATRKRPTRSWPRSACRCRARNWCKANPARCARRDASAFRW
jgi:hypothetical protein